MGRATIGFVEDSDEDFALFSRVFSDRWDLQRWETGELATQAIAAWNDSAPHLAVLMVDHDLPGINGVAVIQQVRARHGIQQPLVFMVSGTGRPGISEAAIAAGADGFFIKPGSVAELRQLAADVSRLADRL